METPASDPNYRFLEPGELIEEGDEAFHSHNNQWIPHDRIACCVLLKNKSRRRLNRVPEMVDHPDHYNAAGIECIQAIDAALTDEEFRGFCKGNALKYIWREKHKGGNEDLKKAAWYLNRLTQ